MRKPTGVKDYGCLMSKSIRIGAGECLISILQLTILTCSQSSCGHNTELCINSIMHSRILLGSLSFTFPGTANGRFEFSWQNFR